MTFGTIGAISSDDTLDSGDGGSNDGSAVGNVAEGSGIVDRVGVDSRNVVGVCQIRWEGDVQHGIIEGGLRFLSGCWRLIVAGEDCRRKASRHSEG